MLTLPSSWRAVSEEAMARILAYAWPGNVRELVHVIELRSALDAARSALGLPPLTYTSIVTGSPVSATDITQLRNGVK